MEIHGGLKMSSRVIGWPEMKAGIGGFIAEGGHLKYEISSNGRISESTPWGSMRVPVIASEGVVTLFDDSHSETQRVDLLVARAFVPNPCGYSHVWHKNGNLNDNSFGNLEWLSNKEWQRRIKRL